LLHAIKPGISRPDVRAAAPTVPKVCLAAEECGHLDFDTREDTWWNRDAFHCGGAPAATVHFYDIFLKVCLSSQ
jgi:hypothetical protein